MPSAGARAQARHSLWRGARQYRLDVSDNSATPQEPEQNTFSDLGLDERVVRALKDVGYALADAPAQVTDPSRIASVIDPQTVIGMGGRYVFVRPDRGHLDALAALVDEGRLRVTVARTFDLDDIAEAHRLSQEGHPGGKIAIRV